MFGLNNCFIYTIVDFVTVKGRAGLLALNEIYESQLRVVKGRAGLFVMV